MSQKNYCVMRFEKLVRNNPHATQMRCEHVNRKQFAENVNKELSGSNRVVVGKEDADWLQLFRERYDSLEYYKDKNNRALRKDAVIGLEVVCSFSHDQIGKIDLDEWVKANVQWAQDKYGVENVLHGVLHMDEATPHIHFFVVPEKEGRINAKEVIGSKVDMQHTQDEYAEAMRPFNLSRGAKPSRAKYVSLKALYQEVSTATPPPIIEGETLEEYTERLQKEYKNVAIRAQALSRERDRLASVCDSYTEQIKRLEGEISESSSPNKLLDMDKKAIEAALKFYPESDVANQYKETIRSLEAWGVKYLESHNIDTPDIGN